eukprot:SAG11_NODE_5118_length_1658_cov_1.872996_2_plen_181_part_00
MCGPRSSRWKTCVLSKLYAVLAISTPASTLATPIYTCRCILPTVRRIAFSSSIRKRVCLSFSSSAARRLACHPCRGFTRAACGLHVPGFGGAILFEWLCTSTTHAFWAPRPRSAPCILLLLPRRLGAGVGPTREEVRDDPSAAWTAFPGSRTGPAARPVRVAIAGVEASRSAAGVPPGPC